MTVIGGKALAGSAHAIREVAGNPGIRRIETAWALGIAADWAYLVVLLVAAYTAGGAIGVGILGVVRMIPPALVAPFADIPVARMRGDRALVAINIARAVAAALTALVLAVGAPPGIAFIVAGACAAADALVRPIQNGLMPALARSPSELIAANVTSSIGEGAGSFIGPLAGGAVLLALGPAAACAVVTVVFVVAAVVLVGLRFEHDIDARGGTPATGGLGGMAMTRALRALRRQPGVGLVFLDFGGQTFVRGMLTTLIVVAAIQLLDLGDSGVGLLNAAVGLGGLIGAVGAVGLTRIPRLGAAFLVALAFWGMPIAVIGAWPMMPLAVGALFVTGVSNALLDVSGFTVLQRGVPAAERVPVFGLFEGMVAFSVAAGGIVASLLVEAFGVEGALGITGAILPLLALASWPRVSRLDRRLAVPEQAANALRAIPLFSPLPLTAIERLASTARPVTFATGDVLMRQGEPGETYLALAGGTVTVEVDGRTVTSCGAGEGIGEIALLRRVPRTATATASTPVNGYLLDAADFLAAIAGPASTSAAESMIAARMAR